MSSRTQAHRMPSHRTRGSRDEPRYSPRTTLDTSARSSSSRVADMSNSGFSLYSNPESSMDDVAPYAIDRYYYSSSDSSPFGSLSVNPMDLSNVQYSLDPVMTTASQYNMDHSYMRQPSSAISPPSDDGFFSHDMPYELDQVTTYPDAWNHGLPTPPKEIYTRDLPRSAVEDIPMDFDLSADAAPECEFIGVSKLQPYNGSRSSAPRPIRSASERNTQAHAGSRDRNASVDGHNAKARNNPRNDPRYEAKPDKDGYYHCPYTRTEAGCSHKPTKQKCIYAKNLDSHLKPYTCKYGRTDENCRNLRFSSNACLFRHEREMHGMHNHGMNPYLCKYSGCDRSRPDNGFPRRWNQRDHMKRVHGWEEPDTPEDGQDRTYLDQSRRKKSPGTTHSVAMKRTGSGHPRTQVPYQGQRQNVSAGRHIGTHNIMFSQVSADNVRYSPSYAALPYVTGYMQPAY